MEENTMGPKTPAKKEKKKRTRPINPLTGKAIYVKKSLRWLNHWSRKEKKEVKPNQQDPISSVLLEDYQKTETSLGTTPTAHTVLATKDESPAHALAADLPLFAATMLDEHITKEFGSFHLEIFRDLMALVGVRRGGMAREVALARALALPNISEQNSPLLDQTLTEQPKFTEVGGAEGVRETPTLGAGDIITNQLRSLGNEEKNEKEGEGELPQNLRGWRDFRKYVVAAPRGHAKSTVVSLAFVLWCICYRLQKFILVVSDTEDQAKLLLDAVKHELEGNERLRGVYGNLVGDRVWGELVIETSSGVRIQCRGTGQRVRGLKYRSERPGLVVCDDIEGDAQVENQESRTRARRWFYSALLPCMSREGRMVVVGTVLHEDSLLNELLKSWPSRLYQADVDGSSGCERPLWPQAFTTEDLLEIKKEYTGKGMLDLFFREYFNRIVGNEDALFRKEFFKKISRKYLEDLADQGERVRCFLTIDPAYSGGSGHDWSVLVQTYVDSKNNLYVGDILRGRWAITGTIETLFNLLESKDFDGIGMQKMDWDRIFKVPVLTEQKRRNKFFRIVPLQTYSSLNRGLSSKTNRIARLAPRYSAGTIFHLEEARGISYLEEELLSYPHSRYDDVSDCLAMLLDLAFPAIRKPVKTWTSFPSNPDRDSISGY